MHRLVLSIELGTVQAGTGKVDPARKFKCTTAARGTMYNERNQCLMYIIFMYIKHMRVCFHFIHTFVLNRYIYNIH